MAYYNLEEQQNAILEIQRILRALDYLDTELARIRLSGVYDDETRQGVRNFQEKYGLPVTGIVDHTTWQVLQAVDKARKEAQALARAVYLLPRDPEYAINPGLVDDVIYVIQHMLNVIGQEYDEIEALELNGIYNEETQNAIRLLQRKWLLEDSGIIDPNTFNRLADEYERINLYNE